ncbi:MAG: DUF2490 domain-containing protein [Flavisolibacter sp.]|jgi:hypothetical protein|nr:DUF2490 domain-containing protein [Flavisolibacter sp.]
MIQKKFWQKEEIVLLRRMSTFFRYCLLIIVMKTSSIAYAQVQNTGWLASFNTFKLSNKTSLHFDAQLRSTDEIKNIQTVLLRPGLNYHLNPFMLATAGYGFIENRRTMQEVTGYVTEHRIWEQFIVSHKINTISTAHRFRLEQRFLPITAIENNRLQIIDRNTSHRFRYFIRNIVPLQNRNAFSQGLFFALQDEVFLNIAKQEAVNGKTFDQNRLYLALGYRLPGKIDIEAGYMNQYTSTRTSFINNHIAQLALYKRL